MRAMILAAGRGERMRPLTDTLPKPLLSAGGKPLIVWHLEKLARAGFHDVVINHAWLGAKLEAYLGDGTRYGLRIQYSPETTALETAGGIATALPMLGPDPFLVINGDIWCDWDFSRAPEIVRHVTGTDKKAWLLLVKNPVHHPEGDFGLRPQAQTKSQEITMQSEHRHTFSGIGIYAPELFATTSSRQAAKLAPLLREAIAAHKVLGQLHEGVWVDVGTPERLSLLDSYLNEIPNA